MTVLRRLAAASSVVEELSAVLAPDVVERLLAALGGCSIYVPKRAIGEHHPIAQAVGAKDAALVCEFFGGTALDLPLPRDKSRRIVELAQTIGHRGTIARQVGCTERWVYKVLAEHKQDSGPDLFT